MNDKVDRSEKLKKKLRDSEAKRIAVVRELRVAKAEAVKFERMWKATVGELKWRKKQLENLNLWTQENCTCGGGGPETGCLACQAYHVAGLKGMGE